MSDQESEATSEVDVSRVLWMAGGNLPAFLEVDGRVIVMVDAAEYRELIAARSHVLDGLAAHPPGAVISADQLAFNGKSRIDRDPQLAAFLRQSFGRMTIDDAIEQSGALFGDVRQPSRSSVQRFWDRHRKTHSDLSLSPKSNR